MTQVARIEPGNSEGNTLADRWKYAQALATANLLPRQYQQNPGNVLLAMEYGDALGIRPIQAITGVHVIEGKPSASADLIASLVRRAGHRLRVAGDDTSATASIWRADDPDYEFRVTWTIERAKAAGLTSKGVWKSYPAAMLKARAITEVAREAASDALYGVIYVPEELGADVNASGEPVSNGHAGPRRAGMAGLRDAVAAKDEPVDAEVVTDPPPLVNMTTGEVKDSDSGAISPVPESDLIPPKGKQMMALHASLNDAGLGERDAALEYLSEVVGRTLTSSKELTVAEASRCIDLLKTDPSEPPTEEVS